MIFSIIVCTITFGQTLNAPSRPSSKIKSEIIHTSEPVANELTSQSSRKFYLSNNFYTSNQSAVKLEGIDTLNYPLVGADSIYIADTGGYVTGNNAYNDLAKANKFVIPQACQLTGILFDFYLATGGPTDIEIGVWDNSGPINAPGEFIGSTTVPLSTIQNDINNNQMSYVEINEPITITTTFYAGMILPTFAGDTLVVWSNADGDIIPGIAWEQWEDNIWYPMFSNSTWGRNIAMAIFPIVDYGDLPLMADFSGNPTNIQPGGSVTFTDLSTGNPTSRLWTFEGGDPATSTEPNLVVVYEEEGIYDVTLTVEYDTAQDTKTEVDYITVTTPTIEIDTLNYPLVGIYSVYITEENGFVSGNNEFEDLAKANYYIINENMYVTGVLYEFAYATGGGSSVEFALWNNNGTNNSPGSKIAFKTLPLDDILEDAASQSFTYIEFNPPVLVNGPFYAGVILPTTIGDTIVVWSNQNGNTDPGTAWEMWSTEEWYPFSNAWTLDVALAIYPIVQTTVDVNEHIESEGLIVYPNPSNGLFIIDNNKEIHGNIKLEIFNSSGNCILDQSYENGNNPISFDISGYPSGIYMVKISEEQESLTQKILKK